MQVNSLIELTQLTNSMSQNSSNTSSYSENNFNIPVSYGNFQRRNKSNKIKRKNRSKKRRGKHSQSSGVGHGGVFQISEIDNNPVMTRCIRYMGNPDTAITVRVLDLLFFYAWASTTTTATTLVDSARLLRVGLTCLPASATDTGWLSFSWAGLNSPNIKETMLYLPGEPFKANFRPPEGTNADWWWDGRTNTVLTTASNLFEIQCSTSTVQIIMDLEVQFVLRSSDGNTETVTVVGATGSAPIYPSLPISDRTFVPIDLPTG